MGALLLVIRRLAGNWIVDALASGESVRDSASNAWFIGTDLLAGIAWTAIAYGVIVIVAAWIAGPSRPAVAVRQRLAPSLRDRPGLVYAVVGLLYLLVVAWGPTPAFRQPWAILIFAALTGLGVEAFRRLTVREADGCQSDSLEDFTCPADSRGRCSDRSHAAGFFPTSRRRLSVSRWSLVS